MMLNRPIDVGKLDVHIVLLILIILKIMWFTCSFSCISHSALVHFFVECISFTLICILRYLTGLLRILYFSNKGIFLNYLTVVSYDKSQFLVSQRMFKIREMASSHIEPAVIPQVTALFDLFQTNQKV